MNYLSDEFIIKWVFFGYGGVNKLYLEKDILIFNQDSKPDFRELEIDPLEDEQLNFWSKIDEIGTWDWEEEYVPPPYI